MKIHTKKLPSLIERAVECYDNENVTALERQLADNMLELAIIEFDTDIKARLAQKMQHLGKLSSAIAALFIEDDAPEVALPILENSPVLEDKDIKRVLENNNVTYFAAASKRDELSEDLTTLLINYSVQNNMAAIAENITANHNAAVTPDSFESITENFTHNTTIQQNLCLRLDLPKNVAIKLVKHVGEHLKLQLLNNCGLEAEAINTLIEAATEESLNMAIAAALKACDQASYITPTTVKDDMIAAIFRPLCTGQTEKFIKDLAELIDEPEFIVKQALIEPSVMPIVLENLVLEDGFKQSIQKIAVLYQKYSTSIEGDTLNTIGRQKISRQIINAGIDLPQAEKEYLINFTQKAKQMRKVAS